MLGSSIKIQLKIMLKGKEFMCAMLAALTYACVAFLFVLVDCRGMDASIMKDANQYVCYSQMNRMWNFFSIVYPFLVVLPFSTSYVDDYKNKLFVIYFSKSSRQTYYISKLLAAFIGTALVIAVPCALNLILCNLFLPHNYNTWLGEYQLGNFCRQILGTNHLYDTAYQGIPFPGLFLRSPLLYNIIYLIIFSAFSGLLGAFVLSLSFWLKERKILLFMPLFIVIYVFQIIDVKWLYAAIDGKTAYVDVSILDYVVPSFSGGGMSPAFIGTVILIAVGFILVSVVHVMRADLDSIQ